MRVSVFRVTISVDNNADGTDGKFLYICCAWWWNWSRFFFFFFSSSDSTFNSPAHWSALVDQQTRMHAIVHACEAVRLHLAYAPSPSSHYFTLKCELFDKKQERFNLRWSNLQKLLNLRMRATPSLILEIKHKAGRMRGMSLAWLM